MKQKIYFYLHTYRNYWIALLAFILIILLSFQDRFYTQTIIKITDVETTYLSTKEGANGQTEDCYRQQLNAIVCNGEYKGELLSFSHDYSYSETLSDEYYKGDKIFVKLTAEDDSSLKITVLYDKRDSYLYLFAGFFILLLLFLFKKRGFLTLLSVLVNIGFFFLCLQFYQTDAFFDWIWMFEILFFITVTLLFVSGFHKKTLGAILSSLITVVLVTILYYFTIYTDNDISYEMMPNMVPNLPLYKVFLISTIFGMLGAVMDISVTMCSSIHEIIVSNTNLKRKDIVHSIFEIGHDTMGTMVNVLFFSYLSGSFPLIVLKFSNNYTLDTIFQVDYIFDIIRFLIGSLGIVLAIPVSGFVAILLFQKGLVKEK